MLLKMDYATFQVDPAEMSRSAFSNLISDQDLCWREMGNPDNPKSYSEFGLWYWGNCGAPERQAQLQFTGQGCSRFSHVLPAVRESVPNHLSRVDIAFETFIDRKRWCQLESLAFSMHQEAEELEYDGKKTFKRLTVTHSAHDAMTIYIGSRRSPYFFRIYNKTRENRSYKTLDSHGNYIDTPDGFYLIRFEIEEKRFRRTQRGEKILYDPSNTFDLYYNSPDGLIDHIGHLWRSYCPPEFLEGITFDYNSFDFETNLKFCGVPDRSEVVADWPDLILDPVPCGKGLEWVVDRFGSYIPFILNDNRLFAICISKFIQRWRFNPGLKVVRVEDPDDDFDISVFDLDPLSGEQISVDLPNPFPDLIL